MKRHLLIFQMLCGINLYAQHFQIKTENVNAVKFTNLSGHVAIVGTSKKEISIDYETDDTLSKASSGNTGVGMGFKKNNTALVFTGVLPEAGKGRYTIHVPEKILLNYQSDAGYTKQVVVVKCKGDIDINIPNDITLHGVSGGVVIQSTKGKITVNSITIPKHKPVSIITETGPIYFALPANSNAELKLGSATGTVYTTSKDGKTRMEGKQLNTTLGTGGTQVQIQSLSGNIHLTQYGSF